MNLEQLNNIIVKDSEDLSSRIYELFMLTTIVVTIIPLMFVENRPIFVYTEQITTCIFIFDYCARWITSPLRSSHGNKMLALYPFTPMAIIDLLSIVPGLNILNDSFKLFRLTRLLRVLRLFKVFRYSSKIEMLGRVLYKERQVLMSVLLISVFYIFTTALIMFNVEPHINPETGEATFSSFYEALYWAAVTLTTVGYGDLYPVTDMGRLISVISSLFGVAVIALPSGVITASYLDELKNSKHTKKRNKNQDIPEEEYSEDTLVSEEYSNGYNLYKGDLQ